MFSVCVLCCFSSVFFLCIFIFFFFFNDTATTEIYTLSLHDALPILGFADFASEISPPTEATSFQKRSSKPSWLRFVLPPVTTSKRPSPFSSTCAQTRSCEKKKTAQRVS